MKVKLFILTLLSLQQLVAQKQNFRSKSEIGVMGGGSYYIGDLNQYNHLLISVLTILGQESCKTSHSFLTSLSSLILLEKSKK